jgi:hypothetical protein
MNMRLQIHQADHFPDAIFYVRVFHLSNAQAKGDILKDRHIGKQGIGLKDHTHVSLVRRLVGKVGTVQRDGATRRSFKARHHAKRRRFSTSRGSKERNELALIDIEIEILNGV